MPSLCCPVPPPPPQGRLLTLLRPRGQGHDGDTEQQYWGDTEGTEDEGLSVPLSSGPHMAVAGQHGQSQFSPPPSSFTRKTPRAWDFSTPKQLNDGKPAAFKKKQHKYSLFYKTFSISRKKKNPLY